MVSLMDIHVEPSSTEDRQPSLEILEVGTGHGSLTLHLAREIYAVNLPAAVVPISSQDAIYGSTELKQRAVIHTLDISERYSKHAQKIVNGFRRGMYSHNVNFHVGTMPTWIDDQLTIRNLGTEVDQTFLSHIFIDHADAHLQLERAAAVLRLGGSLTIFTPSISQMMDTVDWIRRQSIPLHLERVLELGTNLSSGKEWDVRSVRPRSWKSSNQLDQGPVPQFEAHRMGDLDGREAGDDGWRMVCRPRVGYMVAGGGFVGLWRKFSV